MADPLNDLERLSRGLGAKLLGEQMIRPPEERVFDPKTELAIDAAANTLGRWMRAAGKGLSQSPLDPLKAVDAATEHAKELPEPDEGQTVFVAGAKDLGAGLYAVTERVLDIVAPRATKPSE